MYDYSYYSSISVNNFSFLIFIPLILFSLAISIFGIICVWKVFKKCDKPGWAALVPIYNLIVFLEIAELPMWYIVLMFLPIVNIYVIIMMYIGLAHKFNKSSGFAVGLIFLNIVFMAILAFERENEKTMVNSVNNIIDPLKGQGFNPQAQAMNPNSQVSNVEVQNKIVEPIKPESIVKESNKIFCTGCGSEILKDAKFCVNCGKQVQ